jgi:probable rRNA maturation factor
VAEITVGGRARGLPAPLTRRVVEAVLRGERRDADISVSFVGPGTMRTLNRTHKGHDRVTDVLAFGLRHPGARIVGDIYVAPAAARLQAARLGVPLRQELVRLVIHGTLHVLGHDHPEGAGREHSAMWRRQERYVGRLA